MLLLFHLSIAALALLIAVELDRFTALKMTNKFAVLFVVVLTIAGAGILSLIQWGIDYVLGTGFITTEHALIQSYTVAIISGVLAGILFSIPGFLKQCINHYQKLR